MRTIACLVPALLLVACGTVDWHAPPSAEQNVPDHAFTQSPNPTLSLPPVKAAALVGTVGYALSEYGGPAAYLQFGVGVAIVAYVIYDPLAPNWTVEERILDRVTYRLSMRAKSFRTGGDGESRLILRRRGAAVTARTWLSRLPDSRLFRGRRVKHALHASLCRRRDSDGSS
jgi:hypothetical protein